MVFTSSSQARRGLAFALLGAVLGACFLVAWKESVRHASPSAAVLVMLTSAAVLNSASALLALARNPGQLTAVSIREMTLLAAILALFTLAGSWASAEAVSRMSGAGLAVLQRCEVIWVALLGALLLGEQVRTSFWVGTLIAGGGLVVLQSPELDARAFGPAGVLFGLGSALCVGSITVLSRRYIQRVQPVVLNALRLWISVGLWFAVERLPGPGKLSAPLLLYAGMAGFFGPFLARVCLLLSARDLPARTTALVSLAIPVITLLLDFALFAELPSTRELEGGLLILLGVALPIAVTLQPTKPRAETQRGS